MIDQRFLNHPKRRKKTYAAARKIKTIAGRLVRELERKLPEHRLVHYQGNIEVFNKILSQARNSKSKIYSIHEPEVKCIAKVKESKPYEFGNKSCIVKTKKSGIIVGAMAFKENLYVGDILEPQLKQVENLVGKRPKVVIVNRGFRGKNYIDDTQIIIPKPLPKSSSKYKKQKIRKQFGARAGIDR